MPLRASKTAHSTLEHLGCCKYPVVTGYWSPAPGMSMPCAACKLLRRRCTKDCILLPYFPPTEPDKFEAVHRVFGASNFCKMLQVIPIDNREDAVTSMVYEAKARLRDPVYGCVACIASLQCQVSQLQSQLNTALLEAMTLRAQLAKALSKADAAQGCSSTDMAETHQSYYQLQPAEYSNYHTGIFSSYHSESWCQLEDTC
ncbi:LOB domain-containing protein 4-like [Diospyros lotus]|uniref:LOB domain-containing protein 4-like n=1 Tax=Diospyros lotus TaxID=55363 RepID=UPI00225B3496|nr:LOB domain-containing protein 4-like [Diospyros lotus]